MRTFALVLMSSLVVCLSAVASPPAGEDWESLFNGKV